LLLYRITFTFNNFYSVILFNILLYPLFILKYYSDLILKIFPNIDSIYSSVPTDEIIFN
jgi:hypothetical protein